MADGESARGKTGSGGVREACEPTERGNDRSDPARTPATQEMDASTNGSATFLANCSNVSKPSKH